MESTRSRDVLLVSCCRCQSLICRRFRLLVPGDDSESLIRTRAFEKGVLALPGTVFLPNGRKSAYVRASFSLNTEEEVEEALKRLGDAISEARAVAVA